MNPRSWKVGLSGRQGVPLWAQGVLIILMLAGIVLVGVGVKGLVDSQRFMAKASRTNGVVVDVARVVQQERRGPSDNPYYVDVTYFHPVVQFVTAREQPVWFQAGEGSKDPLTYQVGDSVRVLYDPARPQDARLDTWFSRWGGSIMLGGLGLFLVVLGVVIWVALRSFGRAAGRGAPQNPQPQGSERRAAG
jgi:Protein of unknown function (DUF3592)